MKLSNDFKDACYTILLVIGIALLGLGGIALILAANVGIVLGVAWLIVATCAGFGLTLPYWPVVGALVLLEIAITTLSRLFCK